MASGDLRERSSAMSFDLFAEVLGREDMALLDPAQRRLALRALVAEHAPDRLADAARLADVIDGFGPLQGLMSDDEVSDILVNGPDEIWIERSGALELTALRFEGQDELMSFIHRRLSACGRRVDASQPIADGRLSDGSRIHVVLPPVAVGGPLVSIRRFRKGATTLDQLAANGMLDGAQKERLRAWVQERRTIVVSGRTGSGKTTLVGALLSLVPSDQRSVVIEETSELHPTCSHLVSLVARPGNVEGKGAVELGALLRAALRMRPDRIIVGEVRGPEALIALSALATGHEGSMLTVHSSSAGATIDRLVTLALGAEGAPSESSIQRMARDGIDAIVHVVRDGPVRKIGTMWTNERVPSGGRQSEERVPSGGRRSHRA